MIGVQSDNDCNGAGIGGSWNHSIEDTECIQGNSWIRGQSNQILRRVHRTSLDQIDISTVWDEIVVDPEHLSELRRLVQQLY